jgi:NADH-quinone oxidoreductase subunit F
VHAVPRRHRVAVSDGRPHLNSVADNIQGRTICALGDAAAMPVRAMIKNFRDEFIHHIEHKTCLVGAPVHTTA